METGAFNLNHAIKTHVDVLKNTGSLTNADAAELTDHLYDATDALLKQQLTTEEAFIIASKRLGSAAILNEEYSKVNTTMSINKIWAYMFIGFNMLFAPSVIFQGLMIFYWWILQKFQGDIVSTLIVTSVNIGLCCAIIYTAKQKNGIAKYIEKQVEKNSVKVVVISFLPFIAMMASRFILFRHLPMQAFSLFAADFKNSFAEISFYLVFLTFVFTVLSLVVSVSKFEKLSLKSLFQKPGTIFLLLTGLIIELIAACTRIIHLPYGTSRLVDGIFASILFGAVYMIPALIIALYNQQNSWRYLILLSAIGFILEMSVGIALDIENGTYHAAMYSSAIVVGVLIGKMIGDAMRGKEVSAARS